MHRTTPLLYFLIALLCLAAPFASAPRGIAMAFLPYLSLPFAFASVALGVSAWSRRGLLWPEVVIGTLWGLGAVGLCVNISAPPLELERVFVGIRVQGLLSGLAAIAMLLAAYLVWRAEGRLVPRSLHTGALLVLAVFLGRRSLMALAVVPSRGTIEAISHELWLARLVLVGCGLMILGSVAALRFASREV